jgi:hypothetical protein
VGACNSQPHFTTFDYVILVLVAQFLFAPSAFYAPLRDLAVITRAGIDLYFFQHETALHWAVTGGGCVESEG